MRTNSLIVTGKHSKYALGHVNQNRKMMRKVTLIAAIALVFGQAILPVGIAHAATETVGLSVSGPKSAKIGAQITFKFKLSKSVKGTCYVNLAGSGVVSTSKISGLSTQIKVQHKNPGAYNFICTGGGTWRTEFVYTRVQHR